MNDWDKNNLNFIMSLKGEQLGDWMDSVDSDDIAYALELIQQELTSLHLQLLETQDEVENFDLAKAVINKFTLHK